MNPRHDPCYNSAVNFDLRHDLRPGDLGALICMHGAVYAREYGFDSTFEADVACRLGEFVYNRTNRDQLWIAEWETCVVGSIAIVSHSEQDAQLCWLLVDPSFRSMGLGRRLLDEAVAFCRRCRYEYVFLRSLSVLTAAAQLFCSVGFEKVDEMPSERWGVALIEEWYVLHPFMRRYASLGELDSL